MNKKLVLELLQYHNSTTEIYKYIQANFNYVPRAKLRRGPVNIKICHALALSRNTDNLERIYEAMRSLDIRLITVNGKCYYGELQPKKETDYENEDV